MQTSIQQAAREVVDALGPTLLAAMVGSKDRLLPIDWARGNGPEPGTEVERRLQYGCQAWRTVAQSEGPGVARQWFIGGNPLLGGITPISAIRADRGGEVVIAAESFLHDEHDT